MPKLPLIFQRFIDKWGFFSGRSVYQKSSDPRPPQMRISKNKAFRLKKSRRKMARQSRKINRRS